MPVHCHSSHKHDTLIKPIFHYFYTIQILKIPFQFCTNVISLVEQIVYYLYVMVWFCHMIAVLFNDLFNDICNGILKSNETERESTLGYKLKTLLLYTTRKTEKSILLLLSNFLT